MKITDTFEGVKLSTGICAGSATVGRPTGIEGKNRVPRRARVSAKEKEKLSAGGPGSGRRPGDVTRDMHTTLKQNGWNLAYTSRKLGRALTSPKGEKPSNKDLTGTYKNKNFPNHSIHVQDGDHYTHTKNDDKLNSKVVKESRGVSSLSNHLSKLK